MRGVCFLRLSPLSNFQKMREGVIYQEILTSKYEKLFNLFVTCTCNTHRSYSLCFNYNCLHYVFKFYQILIIASTMWNCYACSVLSAPLATKLAKQIKWLAQFVRFLSNFVLNFNSNIGLKHKTSLFSGLGFSFFFSPETWFLQLNLHL